MSKYDIAIQILSNSAPLKRAVNEARSDVRRLAQDAKRHFEGLKNTLGTLHGKLAAVGLSFGAMKIASEAARIDKNLIRTSLAAGVTRKEIDSLRNHLFILSEQTGQTTESLTQAHDALVQSGMSWSQSTSAIDAVSQAMAVNGGSAQQYAEMLDLVGKAFGVDFSQADAAAKTLDKLTVAARSGDAKLNVLPQILGRVGLSAKQAGMDMDQTIALIESMYKLTPGSPELLTRNLDSVLRLFSSQKQMRAIQQQSKGQIRFFDKDDNRRDAMEVLAEIKGQFTALGTEGARMGLMNRLFKGVDQRTMRTMYTMLEGETLTLAGQIQKQMEGAAGTLRKDLPKALDNAADQASRLKTLLTNAGTSFADPINGAVTKFLKFTTGSPEEGGMGMRGGQVLGTGAALAFLGAVGGKAVGGAMGRWMQGGASTAAGVATGKALQQTTGVTPVFVTNWPAGGGLAGALPGMLPGFGSAAAGMGGAAQAAAAVGKIGMLGKVAAFGAQAAGPVAIAAAATVVADSLADGMTRKFSGGMYQNWVEAAFDAMTGGRIAKGFKASTVVNVSVSPDGRVQADTRTDGGEAETNVNKLPRGSLARNTRWGARL